MSQIEKNRTPFAPMLSRYDIPLFECIGIGERKVIDLLVNRELKSNFIFKCHLINFLLKVFNRKLVF